MSRNINKWPRNAGVISGASFIVGFYLFYFFKAACSFLGIVYILGLFSFINGLALISQSVAFLIGLAFYFLFKYLIKKDTRKIFLILVLFFGSVGIFAFGIFVYYHTDKFLSKLGPVGFGI
jgi:hypothetical protein